MDNRVSHYMPPSRQGVIPTYAGEEQLQSKAKSPIRGLSALASEQSRDGMIPVLPEDDSSYFEISADSELLRWRRRGVGRPSAISNKLSESKNESSESKNENSEWLYSVDSSIEKWRNRKPEAQLNDGNMNRR